MADNMPSLTALLGLLAIAGYQNRDKITDWLSGGATPQPAGGGMPAAPTQAPGQLPPAETGGGGLGGFLSSLTGKHDASSFLGTGLNDLMDRFTQNGQGATAQSWVQQGPNQPIGPGQMEQALGHDTLNTLAQQTGLSREEILARLSRELPQAIDHYTPDGRLPPRG